MIYLYLFGTCFHFIYVFMIISNNLDITQQFCSIPFPNQKESDDAQP